MRGLRRREARAGSGRDPGGVLEALGLEQVLDGLEDVHRAPAGRPDEVGAESFEARDRETREQLADGVRGEWLELEMQHGDGNVVWLGSTRNEPYGATDVVIGVLDGATGAPLWTKEHGGTSEDWARDLVVDAAGRIHIVGASAANESTDLDAFLLVLDATGEPVLEERWGSARTDFATAVALDGCGAIVVTGWTDGDLGGPAQGGRDGFVLVTRVEP